MKKNKFQHTPNKILSARKRPAPRVQAVLVVIGDAIWPSVSVYEIKEWSRKVFPIFVLPTCTWVALAYFTRVCTIRVKSTKLEHTQNKQLCTHCPISIRIKSFEISYIPCLFILVLEQRRSL
ncbi:hypothetical protein ANTPLA_LOCUS6115 [Anthophora plagiata]